MKDQKNTEDTLIVLYYAEWCGHCQRMKPEWKKFEDDLKEKYKNIKYAKLECDGDIVGSDNLTEEDKKKIMEEKENVRGYPTVKLFIGNEIKEFQSDRTAEKFMEFVLNNGEISGGRSGDVESGSPNEEGMDNYLDQCGGGGDKCSLHSNKKSNKNNKEKYYEMKYYKYKAKYIYLKEKYN